jgi:hypothetical protein
MRKSLQGLRHLGTAAYLSGNGDNAAVVAATGAK